MDIDGGSPADQTNETASEGNESNPSSEGEQQIGFADMDLSRDMRRSLERAGYEEPCPVQAGVIPPALDGHDVMGQAQTGTGKTASFAIPNAGRSIPAKIAIMAITTSNSISVKPERLEIEFFFIAKL